MKLFFASEVPYFPILLSPILTVHLSLYLSLQNFYNLRLQIYKGIAWSGNLFLIIIFFSKVLLIIANSLCCKFGLLAHSDLSYLFSVARCTLRNTYSFIEYWMKVVNFFCPREWVRHMTIWWSLNETFYILMFWESEIALYWSWEKTTRCVGRCGIGFPKT